MSTIFISGFKVKNNYWNIGFKNNNINIQKTIEKKSKFKSIIINISDFNININDYIFNLNSELIKDESITFPLTIVAHSLGGLYALSYCNQFPTFIHKIILIDSTIPSDLTIKDFEKDKDLIEINCDKNICESMIQISNNKTIPTNIIFHIHLNYDMSDIDTFNDEIFFFNKYTNKNSKSNIFIHYNIGHMIHWKRPDKIINSILN